LAPPPEDYSDAGQFQLFPLSRFLAGDSDSATQHVVASSIDEPADTEQKPAPRAKRTRRLVRRRTITVGQVLNALSGIGNESNERAVARRKEIKDADRNDDEATPGLLPDASSQMIYGSADDIEDRSQYQLAEPSTWQSPYQPVTLGLPEFLAEPTADYYAPTPMYQTIHPAAASREMLSWSSFVPHRPRTLAPPRVLPPYDFGHSFGRHNSTQSWANELPPWPY
jgi:hypothetical protein